ncbi:MAG: N-acetyltransferase [Candidatus Altiarchaeota archaeon]
MEMKDVKIRKAVPADVARIKTLIDDYAGRGEMLARSLSELYEHVQCFNVAVKDGEVIGCCALYVCWMDLGEVKSLAVAEKHRGKGVGKALVEESLAEAEKLGIKKVFTLTTKPDFFKKIKFKVIEKETLPHKIWGECIRCTKYENCDETALIHDLK